MKEKQLCEVCKKPIGKHNVGRKYAHTSCKKLAKKAEVQNGQE